MSLVYVRYRRDKGDPNLGRLIGDDGIDGPGIVEIRVVCIEDLGVKT